MAAARSCARGSVDRSLCKRADRTGDSRGRWAGPPWAPAVQTRDGRVAERQRQLSLAPAFWIERVVYWPNSSSCDSIAPTSRISVGGGCDIAYEWIMGC